MDKNFYKKASSRMLSGGSLQALSAAVSGLLWWILGVYLSRPDIGVGPEKYGIFGIITAFIAFLGIFSGAINITLTRILQETDLIDVKIKLISTTFWATIIIAFISFLLGWMISLFYCSTFRSVLITSLLVIIMMALLNFLFGLYNGFYHYAYVGITMMLNSGISFAYGLFVISFLNISNVSSNLDVAWIFVSLYLVGNLASIIFLVIAMKMLPIGFRDILNKCRLNLLGVLKKILTNIPPLLLISNSYFMLSMIILSIFGVDKEYLGMYQLAIGYSTTIFLLTFISQPAIAEIGYAYDRNNMDLVRTLLKDSIKAEFFVGGLLFTAYVTMSYPLLYVFHTEVYVATRIPFIFVITATILQAIEYASILKAIGIKMEKLASLIALLSTFLPSAFLLFILSFFTEIISIGLNIIIIVSLIVILVLIPSNIYLFNKIVKKINYLPISHMLKAIIATFLATFLGTIIYPIIYPKTDIIQFVISAMIGPSIYILLIILFGYIEKRDFEIYREILDNMNLRFLIPVIDFMERIIVGS